MQNEFAFITRQRCKESSAKSSTGLSIRLRKVTRSACTSFRSIVRCGESSAIDPQTDRCANGRYPSLDREERRCRAARCRTTQANRLSRTRQSSTDRRLRSKSKNANRPCPPVHPGIATASRFRYRHCNRSTPGSKKVAAWSSHRSLRSMAARPTSW